jgi:4-hydroxy-3-polyprenylbenzoate decarboxylase
MAFDSFRDWVNQLDRAGELKRITQPVATELEITELADLEMKSTGGGKALLIEKPTVNGAVSPFPVAINTMGSHKRMAMSMGAGTVDEVAAELGALMKAKPPTSMREAIKLLSLAIDLRHAKPKVVKDGPCKELVHLFDESGKVGKWESETAAAASSHPPAFSPAHLPPGLVQLPPTSPTPPTLLDLPILKCWPLDGGRFITLPCVVTKDPDTGERNVGMYRIQIYDDRMPAIGT